MNHRLAFARALLFFSACLLGACTGETDDEDTSDLESAVGRRDRDGDTILCDLGDLAVKDILSYGTWEMPVQGSTEWKWHQAKIDADPDLAPYRGRLTTANMPIIKTSIPIRNRTSETLKVAMKFEHTLPSGRVAVSTSPGSDLPPGREAGYLIPFVARPDKPEFTLADRYGKHQGRLTLTCNTATKSTRVSRSYEFVVPGG